MIKETDLNKRTFLLVIILFTPICIGLIWGIIKVAISGEEGAMFAIVVLTVILVLILILIVACICLLRKHLALPIQKSYATIIKKEILGMGSPHPMYIATVKLADGTEFGMIIQRKTFEMLRVDSSGVLFYRKEPKGYIHLTGFALRPPY